jgi:dTMP kinase
MSIPKPDMVIFLNMPTETAYKLMEDRKNKLTGEEQKDIHEENKEYMKKSYENACYIANKYGWQEIMCVDSENNLKSIEKIGEEIISSCEEII